MPLYLLDTGHFPLEEDLVESSKLIKKFLKGYFVYYESE